MDTNKKADLMVSHQCWQHSELKTIKSNTDIYKAVDVTPDSS